MRPSSVPTPIEMPRLTPRMKGGLGFERVGTSQRYSPARGAAVAHVGTVLTRARSAELAR